MTPKRTVSVRFFFCAVKRPLSLITEASVSLLFAEMIQSEPKIHRLIAITKVSESERREMSVTLSRSICVCMHAGKRKSMLLTSPQME